MAPVVVDQRTIDIHLIVMVPLYTAAVISFVLRFITVFWARRAMPSIEDALMTCCLGLGAVPPIIVIYADLHWNFGVDEEYMRQHYDRLPRLFAMHKAIGSTYCATLFLLKTSILLLYYRIFVMAWIRRACWMLIIFVGIYTVTFIVAQVVFCSLPAYIDYLSNEATGTHYKNGSDCPNWVIIWDVYTVISMITDFIVVFLPMPLLKQLKTTPRRKKLLYIVFGIGLIPCIASVMRIVDLKGDIGLDMSRRMSLLDLWTGVEMAVGCFTANLPTLVPLGKKLFPKRFEQVTRGVPSPGPDARTSVLQKAFGYLSRSGRGRAYRRDERRWHAGSMPLDSNDFTTYHETIIKPHGAHLQNKSISHITENSEEVEINMIRTNTDPEDHSEAMEVMWRHAENELDNKSLP